MMRRRITGLCCFCMGIGIVLVIVLPIVGWIFLAGIGLICIGCKMFRC